MSKTIVATGDVHVGGDGAVQPLEVWLDEDTPSKRRVIAANDIQKQLLKKWEEMCDAYRGCDLLLLNGDLVNGKNYKETGLGCWTTDVDIQAKVLAELVSYMKPKQVIATSGSPYHTDRNPNMDARAVNYCDNGKFEGGFASLNVNSCRIYAQHKVTISKSTWQYRSTPLGRALVIAALQEEAYGHYNLVLKSHAHYFTYVGYEDCMSMILPCWKAYDPFGDTFVEFPNPAIGYVVFDVEQDGSYKYEYDIMHFKQNDVHPDVVI